MRCRDCGNTDYQPSDRTDVCVPCFDLRKRLMRGVKAGTVSMDEFREVQREMQRETGQSAAATMRVLGLDQPSI